MIGGLVPHDRTENTPTMMIEGLAPHDGTEHTATPMIGGLAPYDGTEHTAHQSPSAWIGGLAPHDGNECRNTDPLLVSVQVCSSTVTLLARQGSSSGRM